MSANILSGARQGYRMADELKSANVPVLVSVKWPVPPTNKDESRRAAICAFIRDRQLAPTTPSVLVKSGVTFALVERRWKNERLHPGIRKAIDNGLSGRRRLARRHHLARPHPRRRPAIGLSRKGKIANVVVTTRPSSTKTRK